MIKSLKVGYRTYTVEAISQSEASDENRWGDINHRLGLIRIAEGLPAPRKAFTFLHEILHALVHDAGLDWSDEDEEKMIERLAPRLAAFLADNPEQIKAILSALADG